MTVMQATLTGREEITGPHLVTVVKTTTTSHTAGGATFVVTDSELVVTLLPDKLYEIRAGIRIDWTLAASTYWRLSPSNAVANATLAIFGCAGNIGDGWVHAGSDPTGAFCWTTVQFNADNRNVSSNNSAHLVFGRIRTSTGCTLSIKWGTTDSNPKTGYLLAGSWLYAREEEEV